MALSIDTFFLVYFLLHIPISIIGALQNVDFLEPYRIPFAHQATLDYAKASGDPFIMQPSMKVRHVRMKEMVIFPFNFHIFYIKSLYLVVQGNHAL